MDHRRFSSSSLGSPGSSISPFLAIVLIVVGLAIGRPASSHPMGNFSINHYARLEARKDRVLLRYVLDLAEIPTVSEKSAMDKDQNGSISSEERRAYLKSKATSLGSGLFLALDGKPARLETHPVDLVFRPGAGGLDTLRITLEGAALLPGIPSGKTYRADYKDNNYVERTGWKEIIALAGPGTSLLESTAPSTDRSRELTSYPADPTIAPPQQMETSFTAAPGRSLGYPSSPAPLLSAPAAQSHTPQNAFTQVIAEKQLTPWLILLSLGLAFLFGALHAIEPGHGKTMVAAYLVGSRGTARHAIILGAIVTITHTIGVFALGLVTLLAARYVVPEKLYPILSMISGLTVCAVGIWLLYRHVRGLHHRHDHVFQDHDHDHSSGHDHAGAHDHSHHHHGHDHSHGHSHTNDHHHDHSLSHVHAPEHSNDHEHAHSHPEITPHTHSHHHHSQDDDHLHDHGHEHDHLHDHLHDQSHDHSHSHGHDHDHHHGHSHAIPEGPITAKTLLALGISGGIVPCPSALVVLLSAVALHRILYGLVLISFFSLGLACVLIAIGLAVVSARQWFQRLPFGDAVMQRLPIASAVIITLIGAGLVVSSIP